MKEQKFDFHSMVVSHHISPNLKETFTLKIASQSVFLGSDEVVFCFCNYPLTLNIKLDL
jgi:hypothetical protein